MPPLSNGSGHGEKLSLDALEPLARSADIRDRAFAASVLSLWRREDDRERVAALYRRVRETALSHHADTRRAIRDGTLDTRTFLARLADVSLEIRDHFVEEILDVAYPPLDEASLPPE